jgi:hypothetical protein
MNDFWQKQTSQPLFPDLQWSRPENKQHAGKLLIIGGNLYGFAAPASAYQEAIKAGVGTAKVLLPNALQKTVGRILEHGEYAPSTPSGSFNQQAIATWLEWSHWSDAILLAGDLGRNSETAITIENFVTKTSQAMTITKDAIDYFYTQPQTILDRPETTLVLSLAQLQKLSRKAPLETVLSFSFGLAQYTQWLHEFTQAHNCNIVSYHHENIIVAVGGRVVTTQVGDQQSWRLRVASRAAVWWLQNPSKPLEALTTAVHELYQ